MLIERGTMFEWPQIQGLRDEYRAKFPPFPWEHEAANPVWWIVRTGQKVLGAMGYDDVGGVRWVTDFYVASLPRFQRVKVALMMRDRLQDLAKHDRVPMAFQTRCDNPAQMVSNYKRSRARPMSVVFFEPYEE